MYLIWYKKCSTCQDYKKRLELNGSIISTRDVKENPLSKEELYEIYITSGYEIKKFFNTSGLVYKELNLKEKLSNISDDEKLKLLSEYPMLIKRPILVNNNQILIARDINQILLPQHPKL